MAVSRSPARIAIGSVAEDRCALAVPRRRWTGRRGWRDHGCGRGHPPIDDVRSTAAYRRTVTQNVLRELLDGPRLA